MSIPWHAFSNEQVRDKLQTTPLGLDSDLAKRRLAQFGKNALPKVKPPTLLKILIRQFKNPLIYILLVAAFVSILIKEYSDSIFIGAVLLINALIGTIQEWKAEQGSHALQKLISVKAKVQRDDEVIEIDAEDLAPGDLIWLESGMRVPADIRFCSTNSLEVDESLLTGESISVIKQSIPVSESAILADRKSMGFAGSVISKGRGSGFVVETGSHTEIGKLAKDVLQIQGGVPPLILRMNSFVRVISISVISFSFILGSYGYFFKAMTLTDVFLFVVALAVSAIPEGLPIAMTVALSIAAARMAKKGVIVRKLSSVEGLGSCTMIATDKTGTLTCNEMTIVEVRIDKKKPLIVTGEGYQPIGEIMENGSPLQDDSSESLKYLAMASAFCNEGDLHLKNEKWVWSGDPVDIAFLCFAHKVGFTRTELLINHEEIDRIPYEPEKGFSASIHAHGDNHVIYVKGAPEKIIEMCKLSSSQKDQIFLDLNEMGQKGLRVLALAKGAEKSHFENLDFLGLVGMLDPPRSGVQKAIEICHEAGIHVAMVTGDHAITATSIAKKLGIFKADSIVLTGKELDQMHEDELNQIFMRVSVFARVSPEQKLKIVNMAKSAEQFVAVTGDGVNDAPALKAANVGVAMGNSGTDVAKEASDLVITDDHFSSIVQGIKEGRIAYDNIRKVIYLLISTGAGELVLVTLALLFGLPTPLLPVQLLWLNLVTNGIQDVALAFERGEKDILKRAPRKTNEKIFNKVMIERTFLAALTMGIVGYFYFNHLLSKGYSLDQARNLMLLLLVLFENVHIGNCRSENTSIFKLNPLQSPVLLFGTVSAFGIHMLVMNIEFMESILNVSPVTIQDFLFTLLLSLTLLGVMETHKFFRNFL